MQLTRAADYAVRVTMHLATLPPGEHASRSVLAAATGVPDSFLSKILQALSRAGLLVSRRGGEGGFAILPRGRSASLLQVIEAIDGPIALNVCLAEGPSCENKPWCPAHLVWTQAQQAMLSVLSSANIAELAAQAVACKPAVEDGTGRLNLP
jgi:Rrf2 family protein